MYFSEKMKIDEEKWNEMDALFKKFANETMRERIEEGASNCVNKLKPVIVDRALFELKQLLELLYNFYLQDKMFKEVCEDANEREFYLYFAGKEQAVLDLIEVLVNNNRR